MIHTQSLITTQGELEEQEAAISRIEDDWIAEAPVWVLRQRARGADPIVYISFDSLPAVADAFDVAGVEYPRWWIADSKNSWPKCLHCAGSCGKL